MTVMYTSSTPASIGPLTQVSYLLPKSDGINSDKKPVGFPTSTLGHNPCRSHTSSSSSCLHVNLSPWAAPSLPHCLSDHTGAPWLTRQLHACPSFLRVPSSEQHTSVNEVLFSPTQCNLNLPQFWLCLKIFFTSANAGRVTEGRRHEDGTPALPMFKRRTIYLLCKGP